MSPGSTGGPGSNYGSAKNCQDNWTDISANPGCQVAVSRPGLELQLAAQSVKASPAAAAHVSQGNILECVVGSGGDPGPLYPQQRRRNLSCLQNRQAGIQVRLSSVLNTVYGKQIQIGTNSSGLTNRKVGGTKAKNQTTEQSMESCKHTNRMAWQGALSGVCSNYKLESVYSEFDGLKCGTPVSN